jgi:hypothetical protein
MRLARAWQRAQVSISRDVCRGALRFELPVSATGAHETPLRSSSAMARPFAAIDCQAPSLRAQERWFEPGPWHASHATLISFHFVLNVPDAASKFFLRSVEWHSAHWKFQFCCMPVQWSGSPAFRPWPG